jgi:hypothetical protein
MTPRLAVSRGRRLIPFGRWPGVAAATRYREVYASLAAYAEVGRPHGRPRRAAEPTQRGRLWPADSAL